MVYVLSLAILLCINALIAVSYDLIFGHAGLFSTATMAVYGVGAYAGAITAIHLDGSLIPSLAAGYLAASVSGWIIGKAALRLQGDYFIVGTLGAATLLVAIMQNASAITGGVDGLSGIPRPRLVGLDFGSYGALLALVAVVTVVGIVIVWTLAKAPYGALLRGVREEPEVIETLGVNTVRLRQSAFILSSGLAGIAGVLYAYYSSYIDPSSFTLLPLILIVAMVVVGGAGSVIGSVLGAVIVFVIPEILRELHVGSPNQLGFMQEIFFCALLLLVIWRRPSGLIPEDAIRWRTVKRGIGTGAAATLPGGTRRDGLGAQKAHRGGFAAAGAEKRVVNRLGTRAVKIEVRGLGKSFDGNAVLTDVNFTMMPGEVTAIIGPNGAGKSTLLGCLAGGIRPDCGEILLGARDIVGRPPHRMRELGLVRTFQGGRVIRRMTVMENVLLGIGRRHRTTATSALSTRAAARREDQLARDAAFEILEALELVVVADVPAGEVSGGQQMLCSLGRALATGCPAVLLDEPTAGVAPVLVPEISEIIRSLVATGDRTICLVEHRMEMVREIADTVVVLSQGEVMATGSPSEILERSDVRAAYIG